MSRLSAYRAAFPQLYDAEPYSDPERGPLLKHLRKLKKADRKEEERKAKKARKKEEKRLARESKRLSSEETAQPMG